MTPLQRTLYEPQTPTAYFHFRPLDFNGFADRNHGVIASWDSWPADGVAVWPTGAVVT